MSCSPVAYRRIKPESSFQANPETAQEVRLWDHRIGWWDKEIGNEAERGVT